MKVKRIAVLVIILVLISGIANAGTLFNYPKFQAFDSDGNYLSGGLLYTYVPGTDTAKATYSDKNLTTPNANPVVLDTRGEATVYGGGGYKFILKTSAGTTIWTMDNLAIDTISGNSYYPNRSAADQGATGNSDTVKFAVDTISSNNGTIVFLHNSGSSTTTYTFSTSETIPKNINLVIDKGALLSVASGKTLTIYSAENIKSSPNSQIFSGAGSVVFSSSGGEVYPEWWGENTTPGTTDMTDEINSALTSLTAIAIQPTGAYYVGIVPPVVFRGKYKISDALTGMSVYSNIKAEGAMIVQSDDAKDIFDFASGYRVNVWGNLILSGGKRQIRVGNANADGSQVSIKGVQFNHNHSDAAVETYLVAPATNLSMSVLMDDCNFESVYQALETASGTYAKVFNSWIHLGEIDLSNRAAIVNGTDSVLILDNVIGVTNATQTPASSRWIDNYGDVKIKNSRMGGEGGGMPIVYHYDTTRTGGLSSGMVDLQSSQLSCGATAVENTIIRLMTGIPSVIAIKNNNWISKDSTEFIKIDGGFDAATYIQALGANDHIFIDVDNNDSVVPLESIGLSSTLTDTDPSKIYYSEAYRPYIHGRKRSLLHFDGPNTGTNITDEYSKSATWAVGGNAALTTTTPRFGPSSLALPDATSYITNTGITSLGSAFTLEGWFRLTDVTDNDQIILYFRSAVYGVMLYYNRTAENDKKLRLAVSSDGASWDVANYVAGSKVDWVNDTEYKFAIDFTGARYSVYVGIAGAAVTEDIGVASASVPCAITAGFVGYSANGMIGAVDEFRMTLGKYKYGGLFIPESEPFIVK